MLRPSGRSRPSLLLFLRARSSCGGEPRDSPHVSWFLTHQSRDRFLSHRPQRARDLQSVSAKPEAFPVTNPLIPLTPDQSFTAIHRSLLCPVRYYQSGPHSLSAAPSTNYKKMQNEANSRNRTPVPRPAETGSRLCDSEASGPQRSVTWKIPLAPSA